MGELMDTTEKIEDLTVPHWLHTQLFQKAFSTYFDNEELKIKNLHFSQVAPVGDHFGSVMFRVRVEYEMFKFAEVQTKSVVVKTLPSEDGIQRQMLLHSKLFETEIEMYEKTLPVIEEILANHGDATKLKPELIYYIFEPEVVIILEDLGELGYTTLSGRYLTDNEVRAVYLKLAKMHAVSYMLGQGAHRVQVAKYQDGFFSNSLALSHVTFSCGMAKFMELLAAVDEFRVYIPKFKQIEKEMLADCKKLYRAFNECRIEDEIFVLNHGDFHLRNIMLKINKEQKLEDVLLLDFQVSCFAPSTIDLTYGAFTMLSAEQRAKRHEFNHLYFECFIETLRNIEFNGKLPKFTDFQMASLRYKNFAIFMLVTFLPNVLGVQSIIETQQHDPDKFDFYDGLESMTIFYRNPALIAELRKLLPTFLYEGYLD